MPAETMEVDVALEGFAAKSVEHTLIRHDDLEASNTARRPDTVKPGRGTTARALGGKGHDPHPAAAFLLDDPGQRFSIGGPDTYHMVG